MDGTRNMQEIETQCCFCGDSIARTSTDPCTLVLSIAWYETGRDLLPDQQFFCHLKCLQDRLAPGVQVYLAKDLEGVNVPIAPRR
jgi:hypothetical protein